MFELGRLRALARYCLWLGAILVLLTDSPSVHAVPQLELHSSGKFECWVSCDSYAAAYKRFLDSWVQSRYWTQAKADQLWREFPDSPTNLCGSKRNEISDGDLRAPRDQTACAVGAYYPELLPTGYELTSSYCQGCPTYLGARWCEANLEARDIDVLALPSSKKVTLSNRGGTQVWKAPNKKEYVIKDTFHTSPPIWDAAYGRWSSGLMLSEEEAIQYSRAVDRWLEAGKDVGDRYEKYRGQNAFGEYRCCEDRDGDGMPACYPGTNQIVVSAKDPTRLTSGLLLGPDCDDTSAMITPAKAGPKVKYMVDNHEWREEFKKQGRRTSWAAPTVITPQDITIEPGMCWINYEQNAFSLTLKDSSSGRTFPIAHRGFEVRNPLSGRGGSLEERFPYRRSPLNWKTSIGTTPGDIGPWFADSATLEKAIEMVSAQRELVLSVDFTYGDGFSSTMPIGLTNCFVAHKGEANGFGLSVAIRRGRSLKTDLRDVLRNFVLPYSSAEKNDFSNNDAALLQLAPFNRLRDRFSILFDISKAEDGLPNRRLLKPGGGSMVFADFDLAGRDSPCITSHYGLLHDTTDIYEGYAGRSSNLYVRPGATWRLNGAPNPTVKSYAWLSAAVVFTHEFGHAFGLLSDEYVQSDDGDDISSGILNCSHNPAKDFSNGGRIYGQQPFPKGCSNNPKAFRSTEQSYMNDPVGFENARFFNIVSCGQILTKFKGGKPQDHFAECSKYIVQ